MRTVLLFLFTISLCSVLALPRRFASPNGDYEEPSFNYKTLYFTQYIDHFNYEVTNKHSESLTYQQRYIVVDQYWGQSTSETEPFPQEYRRKETVTCPGPIFFYTGNESPVTDYLTNSGLFTDVIAPRFGGLVVFAEHRYFGDSLPFGNDSFNPGLIGYLSSDQALADYSRLIRYIKTELYPQGENCPVFAFGGSYGGMLTAWFRLKYSHVVMGGLAASAPLAFYGTGIPPDTFTLTASNTFDQASAGCADALKNALSLLSQLVTTTSGRKQVFHDFQLCGQISDFTLEQGQALVEWVINGLIDECMLDYPYPTNYGIPIVGWPVNQTCSRLLAEYNKGNVIYGLAQSIGTFYNGTGQFSCYNISSDNPDWGVGSGWPYLACTDNYFPFSYSGIFPPSTYSLAADELACKEQFGVQLKPYWGIEHWGGFDVTGGSNIIFSNGMLDPWHTSGILTNLSGSLIAIVIPESAHHFDLRGPHPQDPVYVSIARDIETEMIYSWLSNWFNT